MLINSRTSCGGSHSVLLHAALVHIGLTRINMAARQRMYRHGNECPGSRGVREQGRYLHTSLGTETWPGGVYQSLQNRHAMRFPLVIATILLVTALFSSLSYEKNGKRKDREAPRNPYAPSSLDPINADPRSTQGVPPTIFESEEYPRQRPSKRLRVWSPSVDDEVGEEATLRDPEALLDPEDLIAVERKWHAVLEFLLLKCQGKSTNRALDVIGAKWGVGTGRNVRYLAEMVTERGSLMRKEGTGSPQTVASRQDIREFFRQQAEDWEFSFTYEVMALALKEKFDVGSTKSVKALLDTLEWRKSRRPVKPFLTSGQMEDRLNWAKDWVNIDFFDEDDVVVHVDEKCFYAFDRRGKAVYLPPDVDEIAFHALSKTQIPYVMFLGAVAAPRPERGFDGKIGLYHVGELKTAERRSKYHERGDEYMVNINMDGDVFMNMMKTQLIPDIRRKCKWAKRVIVQLDSAGGHRVQESINYLNSLGIKSKPEISFITQPIRSPDTNVLDLGIWRSMSSRVTTVKYERYSTFTISQRVINAVEDMWHDYDPNILHNIFVTLKLILYEIIDHNGGNDYKLPHTPREE